MPRARIKTLIDFDDTARKRRFMAWVGGLRGLYQMDIQPKRNLRTLAQNRLWHSQIVEPFYEFLRDQDYEICDPEAAHSILKEKFLRIAVVNIKSGEILGYRTRSTTELSVEEMTNLIDQASTWLADMFGIVTLVDMGVKS